jgi:hypothetical protein
VVHARRTNLEADGDVVTLDNATGFKDYCKVIAVPRYGICVPLSLPNGSAVG